MDEDSQDLCLSDEDREEFAKLMAKAPTPEQERRRRELADQVRPALEKAASERQAARASHSDYLPHRLPNGAHAVVRPDGQVLTARSLPAAWGEDDSSLDDSQEQRQHDAAVAGFKVSRQYRREIRSHRRPARVGARPRGAGRPRVRRTSSSSRTSSADPGSDGSDSSDSHGGDGEDPAARRDQPVAPEWPARRRAIRVAGAVHRYVAAHGLAIDKVRWCSRCAIVAPAIDAYQRAALDRVGFHAVCPDCGGMS